MSLAFPVLMVAGVSANGISWQLSSKQLAVSFAQARPPRSESESNGDPKAGDR